MSVEIIFLQQPQRQVLFSRLHMLLVVCCKHDTRLPANDSGQFVGTRNSTALTAAHGKLVTGSPTACTCLFTKLGVDSIHQDFDHRRPPEQHVASLLNAHSDHVQFNKDCRVTAGC